MKFLINKTNDCTRFEYVESRTDDAAFLQKEKAGFFLTAHVAAGSWIEIVIAEEVQEPMYEVEKKFAARVEVMAFCIFDGDSRAYHDFAEDAVFRVAIWIIER